MWRGLRFSLYIIDDDNDRGNSMISAFNIVTLPKAIQMKRPRQGFIAQVVNASLMVDVSMSILLSILDKSLREVSLDWVSTFTVLLTSKFRSNITIVTFPIAGT